MKGTTFIFSEKLSINNCWKTCCICFSVPGKRKFDDKEEKVLTIDVY